MMTDTLSYYYYSTKNLSKNNKNCALYSYKTDSKLKTINFMKPIIEQQVSDIIEIAKLLSNGTTEEYTNSIHVIKDLSRIILDKVILIERELYSLSE
jgi:hypothetical protein